MMERPILMNSEMVRATLDGRKTQTRRPVKLKVGNDNRFQAPGKPYVMNIRDPRAVEFCPYGQPSNRLWVRETWYYEEHMHDLETEVADLPGGLYRRRLAYRASQPDYTVNMGVGRHGWRPSIHMPRWAARIILEITAVCVERVQDIGEDDAIADAGLEAMIPEHIWYIPGEDLGTTRDPVYAFEHVWDACYGKTPHAWAKNPWAWVVEFRMVQP